MFDELGYGIDAFCVDPEAGEVVRPLTGTAAHIQYGTFRAESPFFDELQVGGRYMADAADRGDILAGPGAVGVSHGVNSHGITLLARERGYWVETALHRGVDPHTM